MYLGVLQSLRGEGIYVIRKNLFGVPIAFILQMRQIKHNKI